jgi:hypothetical protein
MSTVSGLLLDCPSDTTSRNVIVCERGWAAGATNVGVEDVGFDSVTAGPLV